ncbi:hypothetical protein NPX13_g6714 [Xylaria arbuscula]|uniref:Uncharacterized protein n=1 Tax=Xylaria arbuscula TaxID=114810 RepID=A0A9W8NBP5_9PEZI|nr:hypothetical protein NPX13_g6714 [Xylaria arbuscula]
MPGNNTDNTKIRRKDITRLLGKAKELIAKTWARTSRRWRVTGCLIIVILLLLLTFNANLHNVSIPHLRLEYNQYSQSPEAPTLSPSPTMPSSFSPQNAPFNVSKVALLIEDRPLPNLAPLLLQFIAVVPPDWRFRFMGSFESVTSLNASHAVRSQVNAGKLDLTFIPGNMSTSGGEMVHLAVPDDAVGIRDTAAPSRMAPRVPIRQHPVRQLATEPRRLPLLRLGWLAMESQRSVRRERGLVIEEG